MQVDIVEIDGNKLLSGISGGRRSFGIGRMGGRNHMAENQYGY
jgi:hypothetical protein